MRTVQSAKTVALLVVMLSLLMICGCAVGNRHDYASAVANVQTLGNYAVGVATLDQRTYVLTADKGPNFVGLQRGGFGNPFDVITENRRPLSDNVRRPW